MSTLLKTVLLIDDNEADNFLHLRTLRRRNCAHEVVVFQDAAEALAYLSTPQAGRYPCPDLIFLDINMPGMNGWEFLEAYEAASSDYQGQTLLMMLSTSLSPDDQARAEQSPQVSGFLHKPLDRPKLDHILQAHFGHNPQVEV